jgi:predicted ABC-type ATPase
MHRLFIVAGCNGAGKTTASYTILPEILDCKEFVNADNIAAGLSPFNVEGVAFEAGRLMLHRINELLDENADFAFETTLATRSYVSFIEKAKRKGYEVTLLYFWLPSPQLAMDRVHKRVLDGGHNIPKDVIIRRYYRGINNLFHRYMSACQHWILIDNADLSPEIIARGSSELGKEIFNPDIWEIIENQSNECQ